MSNLFIHIKYIICKHFGLVLWHIDYHSRSFNAKCIFIHINSSISNNIYTPFKCQILLFDSMIWPYQMLPIRTNVDLGAMAVDGYSAFPKLQHYWSLIIRLFSVKYQDAHWGSFTALPRWNRCIVQLLF